MGLFFFWTNWCLWTCSMTFDSIWKCSFGYIKMLEEKNIGSSLQLGYVCLKKGSRLCISSGTDPWHPLHNQSLLLASSALHLPEPGRRAGLASGSARLFSAFLPWEGLCMYDIISLTITKEESNRQTWSRKLKKMDMRKKCILERPELRLPRRKMRTVLTDYKKRRIGKDTDFTKYRVTQRSLPLFEPGTQVLTWIVKLWAII